MQTRSRNRYTLCFHTNECMMLPCQLPCEGGGHRIHVVYTLVTTYGTINNINLTLGRYVKCTIVLYQVECLHILHLLM